MMTASKNIFGLGMAGTGLVLSLFAGTTANACPEHAKKAQGDPPACGACAEKAKAATCETSAKAEACDMSAKAETCDGEKGAKMVRSVVGRVGPEKKHRVMVKRLHEETQPEAEVRCEIRIVGPDGEVREFTFNGDDFDFDFDGMDFGAFKGMQGLHKLKGLHEMREHMGKGDARFFGGDGNSFAVEIEGIEELGDLGEMFTPEMMEKMMKGGNAFKAFTIERDDMVQHEGKKFRVMKRGSGKGMHGKKSGSRHEWKSDDGQRHVIIERDDDGGRHIERRVEVGAGGQGPHAVKIDGDVTGYVVIVGPDGEKREFKFGGEKSGHKGKVRTGKGHRGEGHSGKGHGGKGHSKKGSHSGTMHGSKHDGHDAHDGQGGHGGHSGHDGQGGHGRHGSMGVGSGGMTMVSPDDFEVAAPGGSSGGFVPDADNAFVSAGGNFEFVPGADIAFASPDMNFSFVQTADDDTISIEIKNGKVTAKINGKKVPADRIKHTDEGIKILGEDGKVVATVPMFGKVFQAGTPRGGFAIGGEGQGGPGMVMFGDAPMPEPPRVMLGIRMSPVDEETRDAYDLEEGEGIQIVGVIKGLPAQRAGLHEDDVIIKIRGADHATQEGLRSVLLEKEPGDLLEIKVIRDGEVEKIAVELTKYDAEKLGAPAPDAALGGRFMLDDSNSHRFDPAEIESLIKQFKGKMGDMDFDEEEMEIAAEAFEEAMEQMKDQFGEGAGGMRFFGGDGDWRMIHGDEPDEVFTIPAPRSVRRGIRSGDVRKELDLLKDQLAQVQRQRDELTSELAEIKQLLKKLAGDRD